jgi:hypothetical protein
VKGVSPLRIFFWIASGQPPGGWPRLPFIMSTTDSGKATSRSGFSTSARVRPWLTIISAMSPTTFDDGVTFTMSPNMRFTSAYISATSCQRSSRPSDRACALRLVNWPPGISWR